MTLIRGCPYPEELFYLVRRHVWVRPLQDDGSLVRLGITPAGFKLAGGKIVAITPRQKNLGQVVAKGKPVAMIESSKYVGAIQAPVTGVLLTVNATVVADPGLAARDPYGEGWIAEMRPTGWDSDTGPGADLLTGDAALAAIAALLEEEDISCAPDR